MASQPNRRTVALILALAAAAGCRTGRNYDTSDGPRYAGGSVQAGAAERAATDTLRLASFNIEFSLRVDSAIALLASDPALRGADVLPCLPLRSHPAHRDGRHDSSRPVLVRVYSTHLGTMGDLAPASRRDQLSAILADAERYPRVVIGGDMNDVGVGQVARAKGYTWPTRHGPATTGLGRLDHILLKGLATPHRAPAGTVLDVRGASDHRAVWAVVILR